MKIYIDGLIYSLQKNGGITRYTNEIISGLFNRGHDVCVIGHNKKFDINIKSFLNTNNKFLKYLTYPSDKYFSEKYFLKSKIEKGVFHSPYYTYYNNLKISQLITVHDMTLEMFPEFFNPLIRNIFLNQRKSIISKSCNITCVSKQTAIDLSVKYNVDKKNIKVIYPGISDKFLVKNEEDKDFFIKKYKIKKPFFLFVGGRSGYKNFNKLLEAYGKWEGKKDVDLIVLGSGKFNKKEEEIINKEKISNNIYNFQFVSDEDLIMFYNCSKSFIFPSMYEGFGLPLIEAMACGTLVLASDISVFREIGLDIPLYFNPKEIDSFINSFNLAINGNQELRVKKGLFRSSNFSWKKTVDELLLFYKDLY